MLHRSWILLLLLACAGRAVASPDSVADSLQILDLQKSRGVPWVLPPGDDAWLRPLRVTPAPRPFDTPEDQFAAIDALFAAPDPRDNPDTAASLHSATAPVSDVPMVPSYMVYPGTPDEVLKRKIRGVVQLQALVAPDGRVADVRVLRGIPRCRECVESAVLAVKQFVYDAPDASTLPFGVWTMPFEIGFNYRQ